LRAATNGGWALGNARFKQRIAKALKRRVAAEGPTTQSNDGSEAIKSTLTPFSPVHVTYRAEWVRQKAAYSHAYSRNLCLKRELNHRPRDVI
jgi:hypothetical protein